MTIIQPPPSQPDNPGQPSLEALDRQFRGSLERYFMRKVFDRADIDDMVQQVFERLLKRGDVTSLDRLAGYVFQTASSVVVDYRRYRRIRHADDHEEFDETAHGDVDFSPEEVLLGRERLARVSALLLELPERTRNIFVLRRLEGMKYLDIAARLGISVSAVEKHMERALVRLMEGVDE